MKIHPRTKIVKEVENHLALLILRDEKVSNLTAVERAIVIQNILNSELCAYFKYDLRVERHGCHHRKADLDYTDEGPCPECAEESEDE